MYYQNLVFSNHAIQLSYIYWKPADRDVAAAQVIAQRGISAVGQPVELQIASGGVLSE